MTATPQGSTGPGARARGSGHRSPPSGPPCASAASRPHGARPHVLLGLLGGTSPGAARRRCQRGALPVADSTAPRSRACVAGSCSRPRRALGVPRQGTGDPRSRGHPRAHRPSPARVPPERPAVSPAPRPSSRDSRGVRSPASRDPPEPSPRRGGVPWSRVGAGSGATSFASKSPLSTEFAERVENEDGDANPRRDERPRPCAERLRLPGSRSRKVSGAVPRPPTADDQPGPRGRGLGRRGRHTPTLSPATAGVLGPGRGGRGRPGLRV